MWIPCGIMITLVFSLFSFIVAFLGLFIHLLITNII